MKWLINNFLLQLSPTMSVHRASYLSTLFIDLKATMETYELHFYGGEQWIDRGRMYTVSQVEFSGKWPNGKSLVCSDNLFIDISKQKLFKENSKRIGRLKIITSYWLFLQRVWYNVFLTVVLPQCQSPLGTRVKFAGYLNN